MTINRDKRSSLTNIFNSKANTSDLAVVAKSGNYNDLINTPTIPTKTSELTNDSGYITSVSWEDVTSKPELSQVAFSGSYSDLSGTPTIPTRTSQLINDSGFLTSSSGVITSVSWSDITNKPNFSTVATSGSYTDLSNTPTIPTKVSQLENDMGFGTGGDTSDCVHKTGNETINGTKTFTVGPVASNSATTNGYFIKLNAIARNEVPTQLYHATFRAYDKNSKILGEYCVEKSTTGCTLLNMNVRSEDSNGKQLSESLYLNMSNDGSTVRFYPSSNNKMDLGMSNHKWSKVYSDDIVHTSGYETINGVKTFTDKIISNKELHYTDTKYDWSDTSINTWCDAGHVAWFDKTGRRMHELVGANGGVWRKACYINENQYFSVDSNRNISYWGTATFNGNTIFTQDMIFKNNNIDLTVTPSSTLYSNFIFKDKNDQNVCFIQYAKRNTDPDVLGLYIHDKDKNLHGIQITSNNYLLPMGNNIYNLGSPNNKWAKVYSDDVVHTSGNETITGSKTFSNQMYLGSGGTGYGQISAKDNNSILRLFGGTSAGTGANLDLYGEGLSSGGFSLRARTSDKIVGLDGKVDGTLKWNGKNVALDENLVHRSGNETINGTKIFTDTIYKKNSTLDLQVNPSSAQFNSFIFIDKNNVAMCYLEHVQTTTGVNALGLITRDKNNGSHGIQVTSENNVIPLGNGVVNLGLSGAKWKNVYATTLNGTVHSTTANAFMAQCGGYTCTLRNDGSDTYLLMSDKDGVPGSWSTARPLIINNSTGVCNINGHANSATYSTTPATTDNSTRIATTAWVRTYVNSVMGTGSVGASVSAYYSNATTVTATGSGSSDAGGPYPSDYSDYINISPKVGTIYTGSQLFSTLNASASGSIFIPPQTANYITTASAKATFSGAFSSSAKYLCTTANAVKFRAYVAQGTLNGMGEASVVDNSSAKSIFIRVQ